MNTSLKDLSKKIEREQKIIKSNQKTININNKEIANLIDKAKLNNQNNLEPIIEWLEQMKDWEQESLRIRTIKAYAQFHNGRISGMNLAISLLKTIIKNQN
jgi:hypothetical protein|tara:strand:+ start:158 stop:460 length:303 start_codon:yes stop_codon:yes gene_type:complete